MLLVFSPFLAVSYCFSPFFTVSHLSHLSHCFSLFLMFFTVSQSFSLFLTVSYHGSMCCWPCWSGGPLGLVVGLLASWVFWVLIDKSRTLGGQKCQGVLGLVFHRFPGTSIRSHCMPVKRAECFPFRDF